MSFTVEEALAVVSRCNPSTGKKNKAIFLELTGLNADEPGVLFLVASIMGKYQEPLAEGQLDATLLHTMLMDGILLGAALARR